MMTVALQFVGKTNYQETSMYSHFFRIKARIYMVAVLLIAGLAGRAAIAQYAHTRGVQVVDSQGREIRLRGINLGNWLVPEGYMWQFGGHVQSAREIEALVDGTHRSGTRPLLLANLA